jgi:hypothetical protein
MFKPVAFLLLLAAALPAPPAFAGDGMRMLPPAREEWLDRVEPILSESEQLAHASDDPLAAPMALCAESGCTQVGTHSLSADEAARLRALFAGDDPGAEVERRRMAIAIALFETFVGPHNGTWRDHAANERESADEPNQLDCIAESVNTRTYLARLIQAGLVRHHRLGGFTHRYTVVLQHVAVEVIADDDEDDGRFVVDSWVGANGEEPEILPYGEWRMGWGV